MKVQLQSFFKEKSIENDQDALRLSSNQRAYILEKGQVRMSGTREELHAGQEEVERYLGVEV